MRMLKLRGKKAFVAMTVLVLALIGAGASAAFFLGSPGQAAPGCTELGLSGGLQGWWKLDGNTNDSSGNSNNGTNNGATLTSDERSVSNCAYNFNGSNQYINLGTPTALNISGQITLSAWVKFSALPGSGQIADIIGGGYNGTTAYEIRYSGPGVSGFGQTASAFMVGTFSSSTIHGAQYAIVPSTGVWYYIAGLYDGTTWRLYINGQQVATSNDSTGAISQATNKCIGCIYNAGSPSSYFNGSIDDARIYSRGLSASNIAYLYTQKSLSSQLNAASGEKGLVGWWKLDGNAKDSTPYADNGTVANATLTTDREGAQNSAYNFNGTNAEITLPGPSLSGDSTVAGWFYYDSTGGTASLLRDDTNMNGWILAYITGGTIQFRMGGTNFDTGVSPSSYQNKWTHYAMTKSGTNVKYYLNGALVYSGSGAGSTASVSPWHIMKNGSIAANYMKGRADDVRMYNRALDASEVSNLYNSYNSQIALYGGNGTGGSSSITLDHGMMGWWALNGNTRDGTPYSNNGTLVNSPTLTADREGRANSAYNFVAASSQTVELPHASVEVQYPFTVSAWVKPASTGTYRGIFSSSDFHFASGAYYGIEFDISSANVLRISYGDGGGAAATNRRTLTQSGGTTLAAGTWYHVVGIMTGQTTGALYINAVSQSFTADGTGGATVGYSASYGGGIGRMDSSNYFNGSIDDVRVWNRALSATEVAQLYHIYD